MHAIYYSGNSFQSFPKKAKFYWVCVLYLFICVEFLYVLNTLYVLNSVICYTQDAIMTEFVGMRRKVGNYLQWESSFTRITLKVFHDTGLPL